MNKVKNINWSIGKLLITLLLVAIVVVSGTYAWFSYSSRQSALVLTIGDINSTRIILTPYQIEATVTPVNTYLSGVYSEVQTVNNGDKSTDISLFYRVNELDQELIDNGLKYTITQSDSKDGTYEEVKTGDFTEFENTDDSVSIYDTKIEENTTVYYKVYLWLDSSVGDQSDLQNTTLDIELNGSIIQTVNTPEIIDGMIPVIISNDGSVVTTLSTDSDWYNYGKQEWANAILVNSESRSTYEGKDDVVVDTDDILAYYVWIPRYRYKIWTLSTGSSPQEIGIVFEDKDDPMTLGTTIGSYRTHPAFWFDGDNDSKVDDAELLAGIWVGKFETTPEKSSTCYSSPSLDNCNNTTQNPTILPNESSLRYQYIGNQFATSVKFAGGTFDASTGKVTFSTNNTYGLAINADSHLMKNSEWGAAAYLSHSQYGINKEVRINNYWNSIDDKYYTLTGCGAATSTATTVVATCSIAYGSGVSEYPQSTTGNITGVFDMSGGAWEYVMGNYGNTTNSTYIPNLPDSKYYNLYEINDASSCTLETCGGHALNETAGWYEDLADFVYSKIPWFRRGGDDSLGSNAGVFFFNYGTGNGNLGSSWRSILITLDTYTVSYNMNGGNGNINEQTKVYGVDLTLSSATPTRDKYNFNGWNTKQDGSGTTYKSGDTFTINENTVLYAMWEKRNYLVNISLDNQNASSVGTSQLYLIYEEGIYLDSEYKKLMTASTNGITVPSKTGYTFGGYYTGTNGNGTQLITSSGYITSAFTTTISQTNMTLYAKWTANIYNAYFVGGGGTITGGTTLTNMVTNGSFENGSTGWSLDNAIVTSLQKYSGNNSLQLNSGPLAMSMQTMSITAPTLNHKYYGRTMFLSSDTFTTTDARFEWYYNDGTGMQLIFAQKSDAVSSWITKSSVQTQMISDYLNNAWYIRNFVGGNTASYVDDIMIIDLTNSYGLGNELVDTSVLDKIPFFEDTESIYKNSYTYGSTLGTLPNVSKEGYTFDGWYTEPNGGGTKIDSSTYVPAQDTIYYANWIVNTYYFNLNIFNPDGSEPCNGEPGTVEISINGEEYTRVNNEPNPGAYYPYGTVITFRNFTPGTGHYLSNVSGATESNGIWTVTITDTTAVEFYTDWNTYYFNLNIFNPDGTEAWVNGEAGTIEMSVNSGAYSTVFNEPGSSYPYGTVLTFRNFTPGTGRYLSSVEGATEADGTWTVTITGDTGINFYTAWQSYTVLQDHYYKYQNSEWTLFNSTVDTRTYGSSFTPYSITPPTGYYVSNSTDYFVSSNDSWVYVGKGTIGVSSLTVTSNMRFNINYYPNEYSVCFNANGGSGAPGCQTKYYGTTLTLSSTIPTREGYTFAGWSTDSGAISATYYANGGYTVNGGATLYAVWTPNVYYINYATINRVTDYENTATSYTYHSYWNVNDGVVTVEARQDDGLAKTNIKAYLEAGKTYVFDCIVDTSWGGGSGQAEAFWLLNNSTDHYYHMAWNDNYMFTPTVSGTYYLRLDSNGTGNTFHFSNIGIYEITAVESRNYNQTMGTLITPSLNGYVFNGWYTEPYGNGTQITSSSIMPNWNVIYYANWNGMYFDGVDDYYNFGYANHNFGNTMTIGLRFKFNSFPRVEATLFGNPEGAGFSLGYYKGVGGLYFGPYSTAISNYKHLSYTTNIELGKWYNAIVTYDGSNVRLYLNGVLENSMSYTENLVISQAPIVIGGNAYVGGANDYFFNGYISDVFMTKDVLSASEIANRFASGFNYIPTSNTYLYRKFR